MPLKRIPNRATGIKPPAHANCEYRAFTSAPPVIDPKEAERAFLPDRRQPYIVVDQKTIVWLPQKAY